MTPAEEKQALEKSQQNARDRIDYISEVARRNFTTRGEIQTAVYQLKVDEAVEFAAAGYPQNKLNQYPMIKAEVLANKNKKTPKQVADGIIAARSDWVQKMAQIEEIRLEANLNIKEAINPGEAKAATRSAEARIMAFAKGKPVDVPDYGW